MADPSPADHGVPAITSGLLMAHQALGAEHQTLAEEERNIAAKERLGTVRRMRQSLADMNLQLVVALHRLATLHGMDALGLDGRMSKDTDGRDYSPLLPVGHPCEALEDAATHLGLALRHLDQAYAPTRKHPRLAVARCLHQMQVVFCGLREAVAALRSEFVTRDLAECAAEWEPHSAFLEELEARVCRPVPAQASALTGDQVSAAILADPAIARAAAAALARTA
ncbi:hypothetical protein ACQB60_40445 [Actinomycetota bacterium Odt1-20B]